MKDINWPSVVVTLVPGNLSISMYDRCWDFYEAILLTEPADLTYREPSR